MKTKGPQTHRPLSRLTREDFKAFVAGAVTIKSIADRVGCDASAISKRFKRWRMDVGIAARQMLFDLQPLCFRSYNGQILDINDLATASEELGLPRLDMAEDDVIAFVIAGFIEQVGDGIFAWATGIVPPETNSQACRLFEILHGITDDEAETFTDIDYVAIAKITPAQNAIPG